MEGVELRARRQAMGLGVRALAHEIGVKPNTLTDWEAGKRPIPEPVAERIRKAYELWARAVENTVEAALEVADKMTTAHSEPHALDFYVYASKEEFDAAGGRSRYGTGWAGHTQLVSTTALLVEAEGHAVRIVTFKDDPSVPSNIHETERGEQEW